jgi:cytochrome c556
MKRAMIALAAAVALMPIVAGAQTTDAESKRLDLMKALDKRGKTLQAAARGEATIDVASGKQWVKDVAAQFKEVAELFPEGSNKNAETRASPKIWEEKAAFTQLMTNLITVAAAAEPLITDEASFKVQVAKVDDGCNACHRVYRTARRR